MVRQSGLLWWFTLSVFVSGCASSNFRPAALPSSVERSDSENADALLMVRVGSTVQVKLNSGALVSGEVAEVSSKSLVVVPSYEFRAGRVVLDAKDIDSIRMQHADLSERVVVITVIGGLVVGIFWLVSELGSLAGN